MATTPEKKIKDKVKKLLREHGAYWFMPVQNGMGAPGLDFHCCHHGTAFFIETKVGKKQMTPRQHITARNIERSGGKVFLVNEETGMGELGLWLAAITQDRL